MLWIPTEKTWQVMPYFCARIYWAEAGPVSQAWTLCFARMYGTVSWKSSRGKGSEDLVFITY